MRHAAVGEVVGAITVTAVMAVAIAAALYAHDQATRDREEVISSRIDLGILRASELLASSPLSCTGTDFTFMLHNYARDSDIDVSQITPYRIVGENPVGTELAYSTFDGNATGTIPAGGAVVARGTINCETEQLALLTPARELLVVTP